MARSTSVKKGRGTSVATIRFRHVALAAYLLMLVSIVAFFLTWTRWYFALPCTLALVGGFIWLYRCEYLVDRDEFQLPWKHVIGIAVLIGAWVLMSGNCGFGFGAYDIPWRNAILSDLINYSWPVYYETNGYALSYYVVFWIVPALAGKALGWGAALATLWLYETCICVTAVLLVTFLVKPKKTSMFWTVAIVFILWSGLNLLGQVIMQMIQASYYPFSLSGNESYCDGLYHGQATNFYYRSNIDCIENTYNQIVTWMVVPLFLKSRRMRSYIFLDLLLLPFSPWAAIGLIPLMLAMGVLELRDNIRAEGPGHALKELLQGVFSPANLLGLVGILAIFAPFFTATARMSGEAEGVTASSGAFGLLDFSQFLPSTYYGYVIFIMCEFGIFALIMLPKFKRDPFFWVTVIWLALVPFIWVGSSEGRDFCMNGSLPGLFVLMVFMLRYLRDEVAGKPLRLRNAVTVVVLTVAFASPVLQMCWQAEMICQSGQLWSLSPSTELTTLEGAELHSINNFVCPTPDDSLFFTTIARGGE